MVQDLFLELATDVEQLDFPILYSDARAGYAIADLKDQPKSIEPLLEAIVKHIPQPLGDIEGGFQLLVAALDYDSHLGQIAVGRIARGKVSVGEPVARIPQDGTTTFHKVSRLFIFEGLLRREIADAEAERLLLWPVSNKQPSATRLQGQINWRPCLASISASRPSR